MSKQDAKSIILGFIHVASLSDDAFRAGYLLLTEYGRPIEFHYTSQLQVPRHQQVLHGPAFEESLFVDRLAKPMTDRQTAAPRIILVDAQSLLGLRSKIPAPVVYIANPSSTADGDTAFAPQVHPAFPKDRAVFDKVQSLVPNGLDWREPFERIHAALAEIKDPSLALPAA